MSGYAFYGSYRDNTSSSGANLPNADSLEFMLPAWVERATVEDGEVVIYAKPAPFSLRIR